VWRVLWHRKWLVLGTGLLLALIGLTYAVVAPRFYRATAQILIDPRDAQAGAASPDGGASIDGQMRFITSDAVLGRAVAQAGLQKEPGFGAPEQDSLRAALDRLSPTTTDSGAARLAEPRARALEHLRRRLVVRRAGTTYMIDVAVTTPDPNLSARIVNAVAEAYVAVQTDAHLGTVKRVEHDRQSHLDALRKAVAVADRKLEDFKARSGLGASGARPVGEQEVADLTARLATAQARTAQARARLQGIRSARSQTPGSGAGSDSVQSASLDRLRGQYSELAAKEADLRINLGERHPFIAAVRTQMQSVRRLIDAELNRLAGEAEAELQRAQTGERSLTAELERLKRQSTAVAQSSARVHALEHEADAARSAYDIALAQSDAAREQPGFDRMPPRIIAAAVPPQDFGGQSRAALILAALAAGLGLGAVLAVVRERGAPTALVPRQVEELTHAPVLAVLPGVRLRRATAAGASRALDRLAPVAGGRALPMALLVTSAAADGARRRAVLRLLAAAAAGRGARVLAIDANLLSAGTPSGGLLDVLRGEQSLRAVTRTDPRSGIRSLGLGDTRSSIGDALTQTNCERFIAGVKGRFDLVLIDVGALDRDGRAAPLAAAADRLVLVARQGRSRLGDLGDLTAAARALGRPVSGSVLVRGGWA
jgi:polysaccharide biosynthesis transport protein